MKTITSSIARKSLSLPLHLNLEHRHSATCFFFVILRLIKPHLPNFSIPNHCHAENTPDGLALNLDDPCSADDGDHAVDGSGTGILFGYSDVMVFNQGVCGSPGPYTCRRDTPDGYYWSCADAKGGNASSCTLSEGDITTYPEKVCTGLRSGYSYRLVFKCSTTSESINC